MVWILAPNSEIQNFYKKKISLTLSCYLVLISMDNMATYN